MFETYIFKNRTEAGRLLAEQFVQKELEKFIILALPRGGVPVGFEIAKRLSAPLDVLIVRKLGSPSNPEYGIGAIAENGTVFVDEDAITRLGITKQILGEIITKEKKEIARRKKIYRMDKRLPVLRSRTVIIVDDGLATGVTAQAAIKAIRRYKPKAIIFAAPVCAEDTAVKLADFVEAVVCLHRSNDMRAIGQYYQEFQQLTDDEVVRFLS